MKAVWTKDGPYCVRWGSYFVVKGETGQGWVYLGYDKRELIHRADNAKDCQRACESSATKEKRK